MPIFRPFPAFCENVYIFVESDFDRKNMSVPGEKIGFANTFAPSGNTKQRRRLHTSVAAASIRETNL